MTSNKKKENVVIIFAKKPEFGKTKTRIAKETSNKFAYEFSKACFTDLINKISKSDYYDLLIGVDSLNDLAWFQKNYALDGLVVNSKIKKDLDNLKQQSIKFENIFSKLLNNYKYRKAILIPMDIPFILEEDIITAFARMEEKKFVLGPEINGGVYLIGYRNPYKVKIFKNVRWSTSNSFNDLVTNCRKENVFSLKLKNDLNLPEDIKILKNEIQYHCPVLYDFLNHNKYYDSMQKKYIDFDDISISIPIALNIVQKRGKKEIEILLQNRFKPISDPENNNKIEIPSGLIRRYKLAYEIAIRETKDKAGILTKLNKQYNYKTTKIVNDNKIIENYYPFCVQQQIEGGRSYLSLVFITDYYSGELKENVQKTRNPRWIPVSKLKDLIEEKPENFYSLSLAALKSYFNMDNTKK